LVTNILDIFFKVTVKGLAAIRL